MTAGKNDYKLEVRADNPFSLVRIWLDCIMFSRAATQPAPACCYQSKGAKFNFIMIAKANVLPLAHFSDLN